MINLRFIKGDGTDEMAYDVPLGGQETPLAIPDGAVSVEVYIGTKPARHWTELAEAVGIPVS